MTETNYLARDYRSIRAEMLARAARIIPEWDVQTANDLGVAIIESFAYTADMLSYYIDRVLNEGLIEFAVLPESVRNLARLVGYVPNPMTPSAGAVDITVTAGTSAVVPAGTELLANTTAGQAPIFFTTDTAVSLGGANPETASVEVTQGRVATSEVVGIGTGLPEQTVTLFETNVVLSSIELLVDNVRWVPVATFAQSGPNSRHFVASEAANGVVTLRFGDNASGAMPPPNANIVATYRYANGALGNLNAGAIKSLNVPIQNVVLVDNPLPVSGGVWQDTVADIKREIRLGFQAVERAVTTADFAALSMDVPGVLFASAVASNYSMVTVYVVPAGGGAPSADLKADVETYLEERSLIGTDVVASDPSYVALNITFTLTVNDAYVQSSVVDAATSAIETLYALGTHNLGVDAQVSEVWKAVLAVDGVDYLDVTLFARSDAAQTGTAPQPYAENELPTLGTLTITPVGGI